MPCPSCSEDWYRTYSNGTIKTGYCQWCSHETSVPTKERDKIPIIHIEKPKSGQRQDRIRRNK